MRSKKKQELMMTVVIVAVLASVVTSVVFAQAVGSLAPMFASPSFEVTGNIVHAEPGQVVHIFKGETAKIHYTFNGLPGSVMVTMTGYSGATHGGDATFHVKHQTTDGEVKEYIVTANPGNSIGFVFEMLKTSSTRSIITVPVSSVYLV